MPAAARRGLCAMSPFLRMKLSLAWECLRKQDLPGARNEIDEAIQAEGPNAPCLALNAEIARREGRTQDAAALAQEVLNDFGPNAVAAGVLGRLALEEGKPKDALPHLQDAYRLRPSSYGAESVVDALENLGRTDEADRVLTDAMEHFPHDVRLLKGAVRFHNRCGRTTEALRLVRKLLEIDPGNQWASRMQIELKSADRSPEDVGNLLTIGSRGRDPNLRGLYAKKLRAAGDFAGAAREYAEAAKLAPDNDHWRRQAGFAYAKARQDDEAIQYLRPLFLAKPQDRYVRASLLAALKRRGGNPEVVLVIDEALAQHPEKMFLHGLRKKYGS